MDLWSFCKRCVDIYSQKSPGNIINESKLPDAAKSFLSLTAHLLPMISSLTLMDQWKISKQIKSALGLASMYLSVWGKSKLNTYPQVAGITIASSTLADSLKMPNFLRRSILALLLTVYQELTKVNFQKISLENFTDLLKSFLPKILEMELKINTSVPVSEFLAKKVPNKIFSALIQIFSISGTVTLLSEFAKVLGLRNADSHSVSNTLGDICPVCGEAHAAGECVASEIAPSFSAAMAV